MWRLTYVRDWFWFQLDRVVAWRIQRCADRIAEEVADWLRDNADRD